MLHDLLEFTPQGKGQLYFHDGQLQAWDSDRRFTFVISGTQSGKTTFGPWWLWREIKRSGPGDYLVATASYDLYKLKLLPDMIHVFCDILASEGWTYAKSDRIITDGKTRIILRSANAEGGLESATVKAAWLDECGQDDFRVSSWEAVQRRLSLAQGRVLGTTTPYNLGWLKTQVFDRWQNGDPNFGVIQFRSTMNPAFPMDEYNRAKTSMPDWKFRMFYDGEFSRPAGMIYSDYDEGIHKVQPFPIPPEWPRYFATDFGPIHQAAVWIAENPDTKTYTIYREYLEGNRSTKQHVAAIRELSTGENVVVWAGGAASEIQQRMDWKQEGMPLRAPAIVDVEAGIDRVIDLLKNKRLFIFNTCTRTIDELGTYSRVLDVSGQPTEKIKDKETFHLLDALRYDVQQIVRPARVARSYQG